MSATNVALILAASLVLLALLAAGTGAQPWHMAPRADHITELGFTPECGR